jgi:hypothetical protein
MDEHGRLDQREMWLVLHEAVNRAGGQRRLAEQIGVNQCYISEALSMKHAVSIRLARALGFSRTIESNIRYKPRPAVAGLPHPLAWVHAPSPALPDPLPPAPRPPSKNRSPRNRFGRRPISSYPWRAGSTTSTSDGAANSAANGAASVGASPEPTMPRHLFRARLRSGARGVF